MLLDRKEKQVELMEVDGHLFDKHKNTHVAKFPMMWCVFWDVHKKLDSTAYRNCSYEVQYTLWWGPEGDADTITSRTLTTVILEFS